MEVNNLQCTGISKSGDHSTRTITCNASGQDSYQLIVRKKQGSTIVQQTVYDPQSSPTFTVPVNAHSVSTQYIYQCVARYRDGAAPVASQQFGNTNDATNCRVEETL